MALENEKERYQTKDYPGTMELHLGELMKNHVKVGTFYEPDLNDMLSAIVFLVDDRVFDADEEEIRVALLFDDGYAGFTGYDENNILFGILGSKKNAFFYKFLKQFRLA